MSNSITEWPKLIDLLISYSIFQPNQWQMMMTSILSLLSFLLFLLDLKLMKRKEKDSRVQCCSLEWIFWHQINEDLSQIGLGIEDLSKRCYHFRIIGLHAISLNLFQSVVIEIQIKYHSKTYFFAVTGEYQFKGEWIKTAYIFIYLYLCLLRFRAARTAVSIWVRMELMRTIS